MSTKTSTYKASKDLPEGEPLYVTVIKAALYAFALVLYIEPLSSNTGVIAAVLMGLAALPLANLALRKRLRLPVALIAAPLGLLTAVTLGEWLINSAILPLSVGALTALRTSDAVIFGLGAYCSVFTLRFLASRIRLFSLLEVLFVAGSVALVLADHRNRMLNRPRFFSDWAWSLGIDPTTVLVAIGAAAALLSVLLFLRTQRLLKLAMSLAVLLAVAALFYFVSDKKIDVSRSPDALGLSGPSKKNKGKGDGNGSSSNPFRDNYEPPGPPQPVAIAILRDDFQSQENVIYFRQRTLSQYNGVHLTAADDRDADVITKFPTQQPLEADRPKPQHRISKSRPRCTCWSIIRNHRR